MSMPERILYYATNRKHEGDRWKPTGYGTKFSDDGLENLRFGKVTVSADEAKVTKFASSDTGKIGTGDGEAMSKYFTGVAGSADIRAFEESIDPKIADTAQDAKLGSAAMFSEMKSIMMEATDVLVYIHGFNVSWQSAVGSALGLQEMLRQSKAADRAQNVAVVLFTWPSDGKALPFVSYKSDRTESKASGYAFARGLLKLRDFLMKLKHTLPPEQLCKQNIHLLCHSMGNYVLQNSLRRLYDFTPGSALPRIFEHLFLCAPDIDDDVFEAGKPMAMLSEITAHVTIYYNREDKALHISDYTKGNPDRLGTNGASHPQLLHNKIHQVDCTPVVDKGFTEHRYYLSGNVCADIRKSIDEIPQDGNRPWRQATHQANAWVMKSDK
ncbi:alpha/beta hydrolase [bacterium]|nr:MAG: alpha/beta hydrolase [bacterium]